MVYLIYKDSPRFKTCVPAVRDALNQMGYNVKQKEFSSETEISEIIGWAKENEKQLMNHEAILGDKCFVKYSSPYLLNPILLGKTFLGAYKTLESLTSEVTIRGILDYERTNYYGRENEKEKVDENLLDIKNYFDFKYGKYYEGLKDIPFSKVCELSGRVFHNYSLFFQSVLCHLKYPNYNLTNAYIIKENLHESFPFSLLRHLHAGVGSIFHSSDSPLDLMVDEHASKKLEYPVRIFGHCILPAWKNILEHSDKLANSLIIGHNIEYNIKDLSNDIYNREDIVLLDSHPEKMLRLLDVRGLFTSGEQTQAYIPKLKGMINSAVRLSNINHKPVKNVLLLDSFDWDELCSDFDLPNIRVNFLHEFAYNTKSYVAGKYRTSDALKTKISDLTRSGNIDYVLIGNCLREGLNKAEQVAYPLRGSNSAIMWHDVNERESEIYKKIGYTKFLNRRDVISHLRNVFLFAGESRHINKSNTN